MGRRTKIGNFIHSSWTNINIRCGKYKHLQNVNKCKSYEDIKIEMTRDEYKNYCIENKDNILSLKRPSIDRIDSSKNYSLDNIQIIELRDNISKKKTANNYTNSFKLRGVRISSSGKYVARIYIDKKEVNLGSFEKKEDAYNAFYNKYLEIYKKEPWKHYKKI